MHSMSTERLKQGFRGGFSHLQEKVASARASLQDILSQARVLSTMEKELLSRDHDSDATEAARQVETLLDQFRNEITSTFHTALDPARTPTAAQSAAADPKAEEEISSLKQHIASMKASRDKLLFEIDRLSVELEFAESQKQLEAKQKREQEMLTAYWKQKSMEHADQIGRLKEMLDETSEVCPREQAEYFEGVSKSVAERQNAETLTAQLMNSEERNRKMRDAWLPTLRHLEARLMDLNAAATDAID